MPTGTPPTASSLAPLLTAAAMRGADEATIGDLGIPSFTLMESAGRAAATEIEQFLGSRPQGTTDPAAWTIVVLAGKGNNGGDGLVAARVLHARGATVHVYQVGAVDDLSDDTRANHRLLERLRDEDGDHRLHLHGLADARSMAQLSTPTVFIDALLGTGLTAAVREPIASLVDWLNAQAVPVVALDIPTGLHSDYGTPLGVAVRADLTVTMAARKVGLLINQGASHAGRVVPVEIGIPSFVLERAAEESGGARLLDAAAVRRWWPRRSPDAHKYSAGFALVVGGAPGMTGAPRMAAQAAARIGAGYVTCACPASVEPALSQRVTSITTLALPEVSGGDGLDPDQALDALAERVSKADALLVGPGLGRATGTARFVRALLLDTEMPVVIDADGLNALAAAPDFLAQHGRPSWLLTPHTGEFSRLAGTDVDFDDRVGAVQHYADTWNCTVLLKGMPSLVARPGGPVVINPTGNAALATAGTGDVLAGFCAGLMAQGLAAEQAACCALYAGGAVADAYAATRHAASCTAPDLIDDLPSVLHHLLT